MTERERLIKLLDIAVGDCNLTGTEVKIVADYLLANGVIVPPCKVGDTVYFHDDYVWTCDCRECDHFCPGYYGDPNECLKTNSSRKSPECIGIKEKTVAKENLLQYLCWEDFGKTVFLSREEAEKALAERSKE